MSKTGLEVAVIGMAGRFPGAIDVESFWNNLKNSIESIAFFSEEELIESGVNLRLIKDSNYVKAFGFLKDIEYFDASFFGYTPNEALLMDPQVRIFHECAWKALEDAGYVAESYNALIGLYVGSSPNFNWEVETFLSGNSNNMGAYAAGHLRDKDFLALRVSYKLNLSGPSFGVYTACSTSLVAIHLAWQGLLNGDCDMALAGGITVVHLKNKGYLYQDGMILSVDGHCRAFDAKAKGAVAGDGAGVVVLKRFEEAEVDGDNIYAVIKASAVNNDGIRKPGFTAPSVEGQTEVIKTALHMAEVEPETINYIETHGTGTELGDVVEIEGLRLAFNTDKKGYCAIGSVKTNIGHLDSAAGIAGFIKTVLALKHKIIPASLNFESPNPKFDIENSPFYVNTEPSEWNCTGYPRRAGISSFGIGGTNAHVILEEAAARQGSPGNRPFQLLIFSANTKAALDRVTRNFALYIERNPHINLADAAYTLQVGRKEFAYKRQLVGADIKGISDALASPDSRKVQTFLSPKEENQGTPVIFMFPGLGAQYVNMGLDLYHSEPTFRKELSRCFDILSSSGCEIKDILFPVTNQEEARKKINQPKISQPITFIFEYALAKMLMEWGITPRAMIGYSFGEYVAACLSGVFSLEHALKVILFRGKLIENVPEGIMVSAPLTVEELQPFLNEDLSISIDNGSSCIVSGPIAAIASFEKKMKEHRFLCMRVQTTHAYHSKMMDPILKEFEDKIKEISLNKVQIPYISNVTGDWFTNQEAMNPAYWKKHLRSTIRFADGIKTILKEDNLVFVEVGPGRDLTALVARYIDKEKKHQVIDIIRPPEKEISDSCYLLTRIGQLWMYGVKIDWLNYYSNEKRCRISLPTYPFDLQCFPIKGIPLELTAVMPTQRSSIQEENIENWFYIPSWKRSRPVAPKRTVPHVKCRWLIFADSSVFNSYLLKVLEEDGQDIITIKIDTEFREVNHREYTLNPSVLNHYHSLFKDLSTAGRIPDKIIHLWSLTVKENKELKKESIDEAQEHGFYSLLYMVKAITKLNSHEEIQVYIVTTQVHEVTGEEILHPGKATALGVAKVIPQEHPSLRCRSIDIVLPPPGSLQEKKLVSRLVEELKRETSEPVVAYRSNYRWEQIFEPFRLEENEVGEASRLLRPRGVYLITGGMGNIGLVLAEDLAKRVGGRLILVGRSELPPRVEWNQWVSTHNEQEETSRKILKIRHLENLGAEVLVFCADVANYAQMQTVISQAEATFGHINGVIHNAGIIRGESMKTIGQISREECQLQFQAKVYGLCVLEALLKDKELDFCWLMSSVSSVLGGLEFVAYSAANIFMDAFVSKYNQSKTHKWISVNWDAMKPQETITAFQRILSLGEVNQVVVSTGGNLQARIDRWVRLNTLREEDNSGKDATAAVYPRPNLLNDYAAPRTPTQQAIADIWGKLFGFKEVGIQDDFLELGGDSLKAITIISRIHKELKVEIPLTEFFKRTTVEGLAELVDKASQKGYSSIEPTEKREYYPLSSAQKRLYAFQQMEKKSTTYNETQVVLLEGDIDRQKLKETFKKMIERHESLRTSIIFPEYLPMQKVHAPTEVEFAVECREGGEKGETHEAIELGKKAIKELVQNFVKPFDLDKAPFFRVGLIKNHDKKFVLIIDMHHIVTDAISLNIFINDLMQFYYGNKLSPLPIQYKDYAVWQNSKVDMKKKEEYWLKSFRDSIPVLDLPTDFKRPLDQNFEGSDLFFEIGAEETDQLKKIALDHGVTLYMIFLVIYNILLAKICGQEEIIVGTIINGRDHVDLMNIIGMFVNTLVLKNSVKGEKMFVEFLEDVKETTLKAFDNGSYPFESLVEKFAVNWEISRNPLFDVLFEFQNVEIINVEIPQLQVKPFGYDRRSAMFDLNLSGKERDGKVTFRIEYNINLFKSETIEKFIAYFKEIANAVSENPQKTLSDIEILTNEQRGKLIKKSRSEKGKLFIDKNVEKNQEMTPKYSEPEFDFLNL